MRRYDWVPSSFSETSPAWAHRHVTAIHNPRGAPNSSEEAIVKALRAWNDYAHAHKARFDSEIGEDRVLGPAWAQWGGALRTLLNGDLGRLDGGTLDHIISSNLSEQGFDPNDY